MDCRIWSAIRGKRISVEGRLLVMVEDDEVVVG